MSSQSEQAQPVDHYGQPDRRPPGIGRVLQIVLSLVIGISFIGFIVGVAKPPAIEEQAPERSESSNVLSNVVQSLSYAEIQRGNLSPNYGLESRLSDLVIPVVTPALASDHRDRDAARLAALGARQVRRAYGGAPPVVPHPVDQRSSASCLACHGAGLRIGERVASAIPHPAYASCTQCHVEQQDLRPEEFSWLRNTFDGSPEPLQGTRAWMGAPPTIPHDIAMRSECLSCHGPNGQEGLRTSHPERGSCLQCHALTGEIGRR